MGLLSKLFAKGVASKLKNNTGLMKSIEETDKGMERARDTIEKELDGDKEKIKKAIPASARKALGFDY